MLNNHLPSLIKKAVVFACFFLFISWSSQGSTDNVWQFEPTLDRVYKLILDLQTDQAYADLAQVKNVNELHKIYLQSLLETADMLITEDEKRWDKINEGLKARIDKVAAMPPSAETLFLKAELSLQRGFNLLNMSQEVNAVFAIRQAYQATQECFKKYPNFIPIKKTYGVIQVMVGSVPDKYQWFMNFLGMKGSVIVGQRQLDELRLSKSSLSAEATILFFTIKGFINQQFGEAAKGFQDCLTRDPENRLLLFLGINMLMKDSQSEEALRLIQTLDKKPNGLKMLYVEYLRAEALLHKGEYTAAIQSYLRFLKGYNSQSFRKDAYYKIGLCQLLMGDKESMLKSFDIARKTGKSVSDPDKYAAAMLEDSAMPNVKILKVRFYTDGGYYKEAKDMLKSISPTDLTGKKDLTEFYYRKGRLAHKTQDLASAKLFYQQTIDMTGQNPWYFAPNAALQLGYISQSQGNNAEAKKYFEKALSYKKYEYKNGIDTKAKSALENLNKKSTL
ncbi:MAG: tetratricopeptide repeat protein [Cyclobacteriaceae bacterium]|nr:tetratricopeptide repeat protein [Cyclobacteriaceae bacterium]